MQLLGRGQYSDALSHFHAAVDADPNNYKSYYRQATVFLALGRPRPALADLDKVIQIKNDFLSARVQRGSVLIKMGQLDEAHIELEKVLAKFLVAAQEAQNNQDWQECIDAAQKILKNEPKIENIRFHGYDKNCHCQLQGGVESTEVIKSCDQALRIREEPRILCDRAEAQLAEDLFDEAVNDYRRALELDENFQRAKEGIETAKKRQKQASKRDYYKILGVRRNAKDREIKKAYRKLAQKWHPDNFQDEDEKKKAEKKFMDIAAAKEVLSDDEKRQKFDHGEDPLDPEDQQRANNPFHGGGQHFHFQGGSPFGGGGFGGGGQQFRFH